MTPQTVNFLKHLGVLAAFGAVVPVLGAILAALSIFNPATLPVAYQAIAYALVPVIVGALKVAEAKAEADLAAEEAKNAKDALASAQAKVAELTAAAAPVAKSKKTSA